MGTPIALSFSALVVDDDLAVQRMICTLLKREGIEVDAVGDGEAALSCLRARDYDVILLDLMLPRTNGFEVIRHLKIVSPGLLNRVIVVTAASERRLEFFRPEEVRKVVRKPFDINELIAAVLACGNDRALSRQARQAAEH